MKNQTYANISIREKRKIGDSGECEITGAGVRKRAKLVYNLLNHASENNPKTKAGGSGLSIISISSGWQVQWTLST